MTAHIDDHITAVPFIDRAIRHRAVLGFIGIVLTVVAIFAWFSPVFLQPANLLNIVEGSAVLAIIAVGVTLVLALNGIDLSIGIAFDFGAAFMIVAIKQFGADWPVAILAGFAGALLVGLFNAALVTGLRISPFLASLGTLFIGGSLERVFTDGGGPISHRRLPEPLYRIATGDLAGIPIKILVAAGVIAGTYLLLDRSIHGKRMNAIGLQRSAAIVSGIRVDRYVSLAFLLAALIAGLAGMLSAANLRMFTPLAGTSYLLNTIAAVMIGAALHPRKRPNVPGTVAAVLFLGIIANGLNLMGLDFTTKNAVNGVALVASLAAASYVTKNSAKS